MNKTYTLVALFFISVSIASANDKYIYLDYQRKGIELYQNGKNTEALKALEISIKISEDPKTYYYLGNVCMNLKNYQKAAEYYEECITSEYDINNSVFNAACAYSLLKKANFSFNLLIYNQSKGDRNYSRIIKDPDMENFRKSGYYDLFFKLINDQTDGITPESKDDILKYLFIDKAYYFVNSPSPGNFEFKKDGTFIFFRPGGWVGIYFAGIWEIDEDKHLFTIKLLYRIGIADREKDLFEKEHKRKVAESDFYDQSHSYIIMEKYNIEDIIPFSEIKMNAFRAIEADGGFSACFYSYNAFGSFEKNNIIQGTIGKPLHYELNGK